jgi:hypothetical protein
MRRLIGAFVASCALAPATLVAAPIDLNQMFHDPGAPIAIAADGSSATFTEDPSVFAVFLSNIPALGDPTLITAGVGTLRFDYLFNEAPGDADLFHFALLDGESGAVLDPFEVFVSEGGAGSIAFDLSRLAVASLGFQFELVPDLANDLAFGASLTIANLRVDTPIPASGPGGALALFSYCALLFAGRRRILRGQGASR